MFYEHDGLIRCLPYRWVTIWKCGSLQEEATVLSASAAEQHVIYKDLGG